MRPQSNPSSPPDAAHHQAKVTGVFGQPTVVPLLAADSSSSPTSSFDPRSVRIPGYDIQRVLGEGGMGIVLEARQLSLNRTVAIKFLATHLATNPGLVARFEREADSLARLSHPNIVGIFDRGRIGDLFYFVMEHVAPEAGSAPDVRQAIDSGPLNTRRVLEIANQVTRALEYAHRRGIVHRDIKPSNVLLDEQGTVKVADFGIAALQAEHRSHRSSTMPGVAIGTFGYMAPEQLQDAASCDLRADVFSLGVTIYEMLTGTLPAGAYLPPSNVVVGLPKSWDELLAVAMHPRPNRRFQNMSDFRAALEAIGNDQPLLPCSSPPGATSHPTPASASAAQLTSAPTPSAANPGRRTPAVQTAIGIDLGTTYSVVAHVDAHERPCSIPNSAGEILTPSVVLFEENGTVVVGKEAVAAAPLEPERVADTVKRDIGAKEYRKPINGKSLPPEVISSLILRSLKADAERRLGPITHAVVTVPAFFDEPRRQATIDAGRIAGFQVVNILNEPTAAAIAYGYAHGFLDRSGRVSGNDPVRVLVYDLGGGTFDVSIVKLSTGNFETVATDGDVFLGGTDWDDCLVELAAEQFRKAHGTDPREDLGSLAALKAAAEQAKKTLTVRPKAAIPVNHRGLRHKVEVTREQFEEATASLLERTRVTTEVVIRQAGLGWDQIDRVLLIGGSSRMPQVGAMLTHLTGQEPDRSISPDEAVAHGAALYADLLVKQHRGAGDTFRVTNVSSHSLGIAGVDPKTGSPRNQILVPRNSRLPIAVRRTFRTRNSGQAKVVIKVTEGESERPENCTLVGKCVITHLPANLPEGAPVEVTYAYDASGRLRVTAALLGHTSNVSAVFVRDNRMAESDIRRWSECLGRDLAKK